MLSEDYGKHLLEVEDLLQKHELVEADIAGQAERVESTNNAAETFLTDSSNNEADGKYMFSHGCCCWPAPEEKCNLF